MNDEHDPQTPANPPAGGDAPSDPGAETPAPADAPVAADAAPAYDRLVEPEPEGPSGIGAIFGPFFNAIVAPKDTWAALEAKPALSAWIVVWTVVVSTAMAVYNLPITQRIMVESTRASMRAQGANVSAEDLQQAQDFMLAFGSVIAYGSAIFLVIWIAINALAIWVLGSIMGGSGVTFGRAFGIASAAAVVRPLLYSGYATIIMNMNPPEIRRVEDAATMTPTLGLDLIFSGPDTAVWLHTILARVDLFLLWYAVLVVSGCVGLMKLSKGKGIAVATILWLFGTLFAVGGALLQTLGAAG